jgi:hypothetical protein
MTDLNIADRDIPPDYMIVSCPECGEIITELGCDLKMSLILIKPDGELVTNCKRAGEGYKSFTFAQMCRARMRPIAERLIDGRYLCRTCGKVFGLESFKCANKQSISGPSLASPMPSV